MAAYGALVVAMGMLAGCATSKVQVSRTPWVKTPSRAASATARDTVASREPSAPRETAPPEAAPPVDEAAERVESLTHMRDREPPALDSTVSTVATTAPEDEQTADTFEKTFSGAGTVQEVGEDEVLRSWPADADTTEPAPSVPARVTPDTTPPTATEGTGSGGDLYGAISAPPARPSETAPSQTEAATYVVQLYAFPTRSAAEFAARQATRALGVEGWVEEVSTAAVPFKVYAGRFSTRPPADELRARAQKSGFPEAFVATRFGVK